MHLMGIQLSLIMIFGNISYQQEKCSKSVQKFKNIKLTLFKGNNKKTIVFPNINKLLLESFLRFQNNVPESSSG